MAGIYIHIPFCQKKCLYCDFYSLVNAGQMTGFVKALKVEIDRRVHELDGMPIETIYFGGGTPSMLSFKSIGEIMQHLRDNFEIVPNAEVSMECNPGDVSKMEIDFLMSCGIQRFSIGAQSFQNDLLATLGRRHKAAETVELFQDMRAAGVNNISLDLIYSIPGETIAHLDDDISQVIALSPEHISAYDLIYEEGTPFYEMRKSGTLVPVPEETSIEMAHLLRKRLSQAGYEQYEISNYSRPGFRSKHNSSYWQGIPYIGLGPSAHSYMPPWRSWNVSSLSDYINQLMDGAGFLVRDYERITPQMAYEEYLLTRLRTLEGISVSEMQDKGFSIPEKGLEEMVAKGYLEVAGDRYILTDKGLDFADMVVLALA